MNQLHSSIADAPSERHVALRATPLLADRRPPIRAGRPEAAAAIWNWQLSTTLEPSADAAALRRRGVLEALLPAAIGSVLYFYVSTLGGTIVLTIAALVFVSAVASPTGVHAVLKRGFDALAMRLARLISWMVLRSLFWGIFVPFGKLMRGGARDRMQRFNDPTRSSYWSRREGERVASRDRGRQY